MSLLWSDSFQSQASRSDFLIPYGGAYTVGEDSYGAIARLTGTAVAYPGDACAWRLRYDNNVTNNGTPRYVSYAYDVPRTSRYRFGTMIKLTAAVNRMRVFSFFRYGGSGLSMIAPPGSNLLGLYDPTGTLLATITKPLPDSEWVWVEGEIYQNGANSTFKMWMTDSTSVNQIMDYQGSIGVATDYTGFMYGNLNSNNIFDVTMTMDFSHLVLWDDQGTDFNEFPLGRVRILTAAINGPGDQTHFINSNGTTDNYVVAASSYRNSTLPFLGAMATGVMDTYSVTWNYNAPNLSYLAVVVKVTGAETGAEPLPLKPVIALPSGLSYGTPVGPTSYKQIPMVIYKDINGDPLGADVLGSQIGMST